MREWNHDQFDSLTKWEKMRKDATVHILNTVGIQLLDMSGN